MKNKCLAKFIKLKEPILKNKARTKYKPFGNVLVTLLKRSKHKFCSSFFFFFFFFFQNHINYLKNTWKGTKRIIYLKDSSVTVSSTIIEDDISLTNPKNIADGFNNNFSSAATGTKSPSKHSINYLIFFFKK